MRRTFRRKSDTLKRKRLHVSSARCTLILMKTATKTPGECNRCGGGKYLPQFAHHLGGRCFACGRSGILAEAPTAQDRRECIEEFSRLLTIAKDGGLDESPEPGVTYRARLAEVARDGRFADVVARAVAALGRMGVTV